MTRAKKQTSPATCYAEWPSGHSCLPLLANPYLKRTSIPKDHVPTNKNIEQPSANKRLHPLLNTENPQIGTACYYCIPGLHSQHWPTNQFQKVAPTNVYIHYEYRQLLVFYLQKLLSISALSRGFVPARECNRASTIHSSTVLRIKQPFSVPLTQKISPLKVVAKKKGEKKKKKKKEKKKEKKRRNE